MSMSFSERFRIVPLALAPDADRYSSDPSTDWIKCEGSVTFLLVEGAGGAGTATITLNEASTNTGTGTATHAFRYRLQTTAGGLDTFGDWVTAPAAGYLTLAGANKAVVIEIRHDELTESKYFVNLTLTEAVATAVDAAVTAFVDNDYKGLSGPTVLA